MHTIIAPPLPPERKSEEPEALPFLSLYLLWLGIGVSVINQTAPELLGFLDLGGEERRFLIIGLVLPAFLSKRPFAQGVAALFLGAAVLGFYLEYLGR